MPRLTASRLVGEPAVSAPPRRSPRATGARGKAKKTALQDRLSKRALFMRRVRRSIKPGLWILGGVFTLIIGSELYRQIPAIGPVVSPVGSFRHDFGAIAGAVGFRITDVRISGADTTPLPVIEAALGVKQGDPILGFSLAGAQARIEALGPIQTAVVERALPNTLLVTVTERAPYAVWQTGGSAGLPQFVVIDKTGNIITDQDAVAAKRRNPALLLLTGQGAPAMASTLMNELIAAPELRSHVAAAQRVDGLRWNLILRNNTVVKLPEENEMRAIAELGQLQASMALLDRPVEVIDLRLAGRMVVRPYPSAAPGNASASSLGAHT
jgi:cell division protein FtsQ